MKYVLLGLAFSSSLRLIGLQGSQFWGAVGCGIGLLAIWELLNFVDERRRRTNE